MTSSGGWKVVASFLLVASLVLVPGLGEGRPSYEKRYEKIVKKWTHSGEDYTFNNLELRVQWSACYRNSEMREAQRQYLQTLLDWNPDELQEQVDQDEEELRQYDEFFIGVYAGSSSLPDVGKHSGRWRIALKVGDQVVRPVLFERVQAMELERNLYPTLDKWSHAYRIRFPKTIKAGEPFTLKMQGIPGQSELVWK